MTSHRFGEFRLDRDTRQLIRHDSPVHLSPKAFRLLQALVEAAPRVLSKAELQDCLWPETFVVEANLQHLIGEIRRALGDDARQQRYVRTVHGFGYAFRQGIAGAGAPPDTLVCRLRWAGGRAVLHEGEHVIGRDPAADVVIDATTVSRHHARIRVAGGEVTFEDLGSKNGSYVQDRKVEEALRLADGIDVRIGMVPVRIRIVPGAASTETAVRRSGREA